VKIKDLSKEDTKLLEKLWRSTNQGWVVKRYQKPTIKSNITIYIYIFYIYILHLKWQEQRKCLKN